MALVSTQPPIQWVPGAISVGVQRPGREADHSPPSNAEVKNAWSYTSTPQYVFMAWCLAKHRDIFTLVVVAIFSLQVFNGLSFLNHISTYHKAVSSVRGTTGRTFRNREDKIQNE
jgi:hypothetical protein